MSADLALFARAWLSAFVTLDRERRVLAIAEVRRRAAHHPRWRAAEDAIVALCLDVLEDVSRLAPREAKER